ncbi:MAG: ABC transporter ATP-binding protein [Leptospiraceae bacterium]|nr:ABC transporter ATP-binding protein [Leptospiraceae bacterium]
MIKVQNLTKYYSDKLAISDLNFQINKGEVVGLLGLNGSGKTTTIRMLSGFLIPNEGEVWIDDLNSFSDPIEIKRKVGYLPETPPLYEDLTIRDYLEFVARIKSVSNIESEIKRVCEVTNLMDVIDQYISHLSLGFRKRVGIAQAILGFPKIVIMDEPISGLDPRQIVEIRHLIRNLSKEHTVLLSSHILSEVYLVCDRFIFIHEGKLVYDYSRVDLEKEMQKISELQIGLRGNSKEECKSFLENIIQNVEVKLLEENKDYYLFGVRPENLDSYRDKLLFNLTGKGFKLELLKKEDITLEQFFIDRI